MSHPPTPTGEIAGYTSAALVVVTAIGAGLSKLVGWRGESRKTRAAGLQEWEDKLSTREGELDTKIEHRLAELEKNSAAQGEEITALRIAFELVAGALRAIDPANPALSRASEVLARCFPLPGLAPPADMAAQLGAIDRADLAATAAGRRTGERT